MGDENMKIRVEVDNGLIEEEVTIRCKQINSSIQAIERAIEAINSGTGKLVCYQEEKEYYLGLKDILFFETFENSVSVHTIEEVYKIKSKLYELEETLPRSFIRVAKSTIVNVDAIYSITHNITSSSLIEFRKSHKQVYVSRFYYKDLKNRLEERRNYEI